MAFQTREAPRHLARVEICVWAALSEGSMHVPKGTCDSTLRLSRTSLRTSLGPNCMRYGGKQRIDEALWTTKEL